VPLMAGLRHGPRILALDAEFGGSLIDAQVEVAVSGRPWPPSLLAAVTSVTTADFELSESSVDTSLDLVGVAVKR
ncbi:SAM-dependent methyltransferase, partial [Kibdelosporangium lantanae]